MEPVSAFMAAYGGYIAAAGAVVSAGTSYMQAEAQKEQQEAYNKAVVKDTIRQYGELDKAEADALEEEHKSSLEAKRQMMSARSSVLLAASVTGTYGNSVNTAIEDINTGYGQRIGEITARRKRQLDNIDSQALSLRAQSSMKQDRTISQPSWYSALSSGLSTYSAASGVTDKVANAYKLSQTAVRSGG